MTHGDLRAHDDRGMNRRTLAKSVLGAIAVVVVVPLVAVPASAQGHGLTWTPCVDVAEDWDPGDRRSECAVVAVPLDYADPGGRKIDIAVSRIPASGRSEGVVVFNPGGPGHPGTTMPADIAASRAGGIGVRHDLVGFDP